jgi:uncharacterized protein (DUF1015 family)
VPRFEPFRALRYAGAPLAEAVAPPYDVLSDSDVDELERRSATNIVRVDVPRGGPDRYGRAAELLADWQRDGVLVRDPVPSFTLYRMSFTDEHQVQRQIVGVLGGLEVVDEGAGGVLPHERTTPKASTDRLDLTRATRANLSPVWGLSLASGLTDVLREPAELAGEVTDADGVVHRVERVSDPERLVAISAAVARDDVLIADGHHRYGISRTYRDEVRARIGNRNTPAEQTLAFVNELVPEQLSVAAIHRLYRDVAFEELRSALETGFALTPTETPSARTLSQMVAEGFLVLVGPDGAWRLTPRDGAFDGLRSLDGLWLERLVSATSATAGYQHGLGETLAAVAHGSATAAVLIRPVSVAEIERTAREGLLMPPKSTFFTPKLKTGFVLRPLDEPPGAVGPTP